MVLILSDAPPAARTPWLPFQGPIPPIRGKCPEGTKGVGTLSPKVTERSSQICCNLSVSAFRRATSPERGGFFAHTAKNFCKNQQKSHPDLATPYSPWYNDTVFSRNGEKAGTRFSSASLQKKIV